MYQRQARGKGRYVLFDPSMRAAVLERHGLHAELQRARSSERAFRRRLPADRRPRATAGSTAVEALVRWHHPARGPVAPSEFIPLAEETGLIAPLGPVRAPRRPAASARWLDGGRSATDFAVHVNLSAVELEDPDLVAARRGRPRRVRAGRRTSWCSSSPRARPAATPIRGADQLAAAARARRPAGDRRLRHRLLVAELPARAADRHPQDRRPFVDGCRAPPQEAVVPAA